MALATCELLWLLQLLTALRVRVSSPVKLFCDSKSALHISMNPISTSVLNMWRLTVTPHEIRLSLASSRFFMCRLRTNMLIFKQRNFILVPFTLFSTVCRYQASSPLLPLHAWNMCISVLLKLYIILYTCT